MARSEKKAPFRDTTQRLFIRQATIADIPAIIALSAKAYAGTGMHGYSSGPLNGQMHNFPGGQFVAVLGEQLVGYCATFRISEAVGLAPHNWTEITGNGYASRHDPDGDWLYGMEVCVDPDVRGYRVGQRLYNARKQLCQDLGLKGVVFVGRLPTLQRRRKRFATVREYVDQIIAGKQRDPVLSFQLHNGFEVHGIVDHYLDADLESMGCGVHLVWRNPKVSQDNHEAQRKRYGARVPDSIRVGAVQYMQRRVNSFEEFADIVTYFVDVVANYKGDFVVFPEMFSLQLLSMEENELDPVAAIEALTRHTPRFCEMFRELAIRFNINIIGGSHPTKMEDGSVQNIAYIFLRDGTVHQQAKIHPTPNEAYWWNIHGGRKLTAIDTDCGPIGVLICYDSEFPELARHLVDQGIRILFVPFCTDERQSFLRVRYCCQSRAVENQLYVVMAGNVGNLPRVHNMDIQYAQSCILTPCDFPFSRDGIAADSTPNVEMVLFADLRTDSLELARQAGTVKNLQNRRHDLYSVQWHGE